MGVVDAAADRGALAQVARLGEDGDLRVRRREPRELGGRAVRGAVVDQQDLEAQVELEQLVDDLRDGRSSL